MADTEVNKKNLDQDNINNMNGEQKSGLEAEDIVADAIKLNVDDDLNEQRYEQSSNKSSNFQNGNQLDNTNLEDEPNYEVDEDEEEIINEQDDQNNDEQNLNETEQQKQQDDNKNIENLTEQTSTETTNKDDKTNNNPTPSSNDDNNKESKKNEIKIDTAKSKDENVNSKKESNDDSDTKSTSKSKSDKPKDKEQDKSTDRKISDSKSNDKVVWVSGISSNTKACDLQTLFKKYGKVLSAKIIKNDKLSGSKYFGVLTMETIEQAEKCIQSLNKTELDGKTITVEKNRLIEEKDKKSSEKEKSSSEKDKKDDKEKDKSSSSKDKRVRSKSRSKSRSRAFKRRSFSPNRRFPPPPGAFHRGPFNYSGPRRGGGPPFFPNRGRPGGHFIPRGPPMGFNRGPPMGMPMMRKFEMERKIRNMREIRDRREEDFRRQRDLERKQHEEREKLEREKMRLKIERERLEREKADFLRVEREKARMERERIEREREELRRKQTSFNQQLPSASKRPYDDIYSTSSWDDRKSSSQRFSASGNTNSALSTTRPVFDLENASSSNNYYSSSLTSVTSNLIASSTDLIDRRKLDSSILGRDAYESNKRNTGYERDDRSGRSINGSSNSQLNYFKDTSNRNPTGLPNRDSRGRRDEGDWKSNLDRRNDSRTSFLEHKNPLTAANPTAPSYLASSTNRSNYDRAPDSWASAPDRGMPASLSSKFSSYSVSSLTDRRAPPPSLSQQGNNIVGSTIGLYNPPNVSLNNMSNNNSNYGGNINSSSFRRY